MEDCSNLVVVVSCRRSPIVGVRRLLLSVLGVLLLVAVLAVAAAAAVSVLGGRGRMAGAVVVGVVGVGVEVARVGRRRQAEGGCNGKVQRMASFSEKAAKDIMNDHHFLFNSATAAAVCMWGLGPVTQMQP